MDATRKRREGKRVRAEAVPLDLARQKLGDLIDRAGFKGERIPLTRHGKEIVALVSIADLEKIEAA